jgi:hypothetical protein
LHLHNLSKFKIQKHRGKQYPDVKTAKTMDQVGNRRKKRKIQKRLLR